jgi:hypothetical protein
LGEGVKKLTQKQSTSRKDTKTQSFAKQTNDLYFAGLCVFAPWREIVYFFTSSDGRAASDQLGGKWFQVLIFRPEIPLVIYRLRT